MPKLRVLAVSLVVIAVLVAMVLPMAVSAQVVPPALYQCTVYEGGELAGVGVTVSAHVGTEVTARAEADTDALGVAVLVVPIGASDIGKAITFVVDGVVATETPDVDVSLQSQQVRLDVGAFDPLDYDTDQDGELSKTETLAAINDYFDQTITKDQVLQVVILYFS